MNNDFTPRRPQKRLSLSADTPPLKSTSEEPAPKKMLPSRASKKGSWLLFWQRIHLSRTQWILAGAAFIILLGGLSAAVIALFGKKEQPVATEIQAPVEEKKSDTEPSRLTGVQVKPKLNERPVTGIMIENSPDARPQSGLLEAGVVFEAIAEGGITRFLALYQEARPEYIGPVRSVRPYYIDWAMGYDAAIAHVGGAPQALIDIGRLGTKDLDQFHNPGAYWRIPERYAPHNMYTKMSNLDALNKSKGYKSSQFDGFARKETGKELSAKSAKTIDLNISGDLYNVHYAYNSKGKCYRRSQGGVPHTDLRSRKQLCPDVVVAFVISRGIASDGQHTNYKTTGSGKALVFQDGRRATVTWKKTGRKNEFKLFGADGEPFKLNPGQTWITAVDSTTSVSYRP